MDFFHYTQYRATYDALAEEYEHRVDALTPVVSEAVGWFSQFMAPGSTALDIGCGVGITTKELLKRGFKVTSIDISPKMIEFTNARNPEAECIVDDFLTHEFTVPFDAALSFAFIHLFPKQDALDVLYKIYAVLKPGGLLYTGTTRSDSPSEGWEVKEDYTQKQRRYRAHWTEDEFKETLVVAGFETIAYKTHPDPFGKLWMDVIVKKVRA